MQGRGASSKFATRIFSEVRDFDFTEVDFRKSHRAAVSRRLSRGIDVIYEYRHPLIAGAMSIDGSSALARRFDFDPFTSSFNRIVWIGAFDDEIGMTVEVAILS